MAAAMDGPLDCSIAQKEICVRRIKLQRRTFDLSSKQNHRFVFEIHVFSELIERAFGESQYDYRPKRGARDAVMLYGATWLTMLNNRKKKSE